MSRPRESEPQTLIAGLLYREKEVLAEALRRLVDGYGPLDFLSEPLPFHYSTYYEKEMGSDIFRRFAAFSDPVDPETLPDVKLQTNTIEGHLAENHRRRVNIDPGLLSPDRLVLATGKSAAHRIYLRAGIYADLTLIFQKGAYQPLPWTYPDYREPVVRHAFGALRAAAAGRRWSRLPRSPVALPEDPS